MLCAIFSSATRTRSRLEHWHRREPLERVGAGWEHSGNAVTPSLAGTGVLRGERAVAQQRLDPRPFASRRDPGPQVPPRLHARRGIVPRLREHSVSPQHATPGARSLGRALELDSAHAIAQLREHRGGRACRRPPATGSRVRRSKLTSYGSSPSQNALRGRWENMKHLAREHVLACYQDLGQAIATKSSAVGVASVRWSASVSEPRTHEATPMNPGAKRPMPCLEPPMRRQGIIGEPRASTLSCAGCRTVALSGFRPNLGRMSGLRPDSGQRRL